MPDGNKIGVLNLSGRVFMANTDCPFRKAQSEIEALQKDTTVIVIDFHAEATSEKVAFGYFVDGKVSAVLGTHTHVQTADEKILPNGTAYITDVGMTGPVHSVIGIDVDQIIRRFLTGMPDRFETGQGKGIFSAIVVDIDQDSGKATGIQRLQLSYP
jgi:metallophosphoesterase (TIGR00282 family)